MAVARSYAVGLEGLDGHVVEVEADLAQGLPGLTVIGPRLQQWRGLAMRSDKHAHSYEGGLLLASVILWGRA